jgi:hypothetical protein
MIMKSLGNGAIAMSIVFLALAGIASAQFSSDGTIVYMGELSFLATSHCNQEAKAQEATILGAEANNSTQNATALGNITANETAEKNLAPVSLGSAKPVEAARPSDNGILDLSAYAEDRANNSLTGYTNIMYPITGSRGSTASTSSGGGCCGGG